MSTMITFVTTGDSEGITVRAQKGISPSVEIPLNEPFDISPFAVTSQPWEPSNEVRVSAEIAVTEMYSVSSGTWNASFSTEAAAPGYTIQSAILDAANDDGGDHVITIETSGASSVVSPYNKVYIVDAEKITEFSNIPIMPPSGSGEPSDFNVTDYIIGLLSIPFKLPDDVSDGESDIVLGNLVTDILAPVANSDLITIPLGEITVGDFKGNSLDYISTEYTLILPFIDSEISLNPEWVVDKIISVEYRLDVYSGDITVNVYNGNDSPIVSTKSSVGRMIPFKTTRALESAIGNNQGIENGLLSAYIRKSFKRMIEGDFSNLITDEGILGDFTGYVRSEVSNLKTRASLSEKQQILSLLQGGVFINE